MGPALHLIARLYAVEERAKALSLSAEQRLALRQRVSARLLGKLHQYLLELQPEVLPKSPSGAAVRYALNQWEALTRFLEDGELEIDNGATERANRDIALGRGNWTFFGSDSGGKTAAVLRSFIASCKRCGVEPFAWFRDVLSRIPAHSITRLSELLPHNWKALCELSVSVRRASSVRTEALYFWSMSGGLTLMNSLSHLWCLPDLVGRPPGKVRSSIWISDIRSCSAHRHVGSFRLLEPAT